jgi:drug/metabolite transporter (DMT)-like permease
MIAAYGAANLLQSIAASRTDANQGFHPMLLLRLGRHKSYIVGLICQFVGFGLGFLSRRDLPLFLVQSSVAAGLGVTTILGVLILKWNLPLSEVLLLILLCLGIAAMIVAARPSPSRQLGLAGDIGLVVALIGIGIGGFFAARLQGSPGSVALGSLAGVAFGAAAVASRPLASVHSWGAFATDPLLYLLLAHTVVAQLLLGLAMQRGSTTAAVAAMDAATAVPAAIIGLLFLGDEIQPGRGWLVIVGFVLTLGGVIGLSFYAEPQHHHKVIPGRHRKGVNGSTPDPAVVDKAQAVHQDTMTGFGMEKPLPLRTAKN